MPEKSYRYIITSENLFILFFIYVFIYFHIKTTSIWQWDIASYVFWLNIVGLIRWMVWNFFSDFCNVATYARRAGIFNGKFTANLPVKKTENRLSFDRIMATSL